MYECNNVINMYECNNRMYKYIYAHEKGINGTEHIQYYIFYSFIF